MTLFMVVNFTTKFRKEHRARLLMRTNADDDDDDADDAENDDDDAITKILQGNSYTNHVGWINYTSFSCKFLTVYRYVPKITKIR